MPHQGKPSGACRKCKQRHIRCDERRPACQRCLKANYVCPGYTEGLDLVLRDQNDVAKASVSRREKAALKARLECENLEGQNRKDLGDTDQWSLSSPSSPSSRGSIETTKREISPTYLAPSEDDYQLCLFMGTWVSYPHDEQGDRGFVELLPSMYSFAKLESPLTLCVAAISGALSAKFVRKLRDVEIPDVRRKYSKALRATMTALSDPIESLTDETLMAVCLLGFYEAVVASFQGRISSARHFNGAAALINQRQGQLNTNFVQRLLLGVRSSILQRAVAFSTPIDTSSPIWQISDSSPHNPATLLDQMSIEIPNLLVAASRYHEEGRGQANALNSLDTENPKKQKIIAKALVIDASLSTWPASTPETWKPIRLSASDIPKSITAIGGVYQSHCDIYPDVVVSETWNSYRTARLRVLSIIAQFSIPQSINHFRAVAEIQTLTDAICASVPYGLGNRTAPVPLYSTEARYPSVGGAPLSSEHHRTALALGGWYLLRPMKEVMQMDRWLRPGQIAWARAQLHRLANAYDVEPIDQALSLVVLEEKLTD